MSTPRKSLNVINPNDKLEQLRREFEADSSSPASHVEAPTGQGITADIIESLRTVYDPEIPVNVYDLGLIYDIAIDASGAAVVRMTLTAPGCPVAADIVAEVQRKVRAVPGVTSANIDLTFDPPWGKERMSEAALLELGLI